MANKAFCGDNLRAAVWLEISAWGGDVEAGYELPIKNDGTVVGETIERIESAIANGTREEGDRYDGKISATGLKMVVVASYESLPWLLRLFAGEITNGGAGPYTHARDGFGTLAATVEAFGVEIALVDTDVAANSVLYVCKGCQVTAVSWPLFGVAGPIPITITFDAKSCTRSSAAPMAATTFSESPVLFNDTTVLTLGGAAISDGAEGTLEITFGDAMVHTANNGGRVGFRYRRMGKCRVNANFIEHKDSAIPAAAAARTAQTLIVTITTGATEICTITAANLVLALSPVNVGNDTVIIQTVGDCDAPTWNITNSTATYPTPV